MKSSAIFSSAKTVNGLNRPEAMTKSARDLVGGRNSGGSGKARTRPVARQIPFSGNGAIPWRRLSPLYSVFLGGGAPETVGNRPPLGRFGKRFHDDRLCSGLVAGVPLGIQRACKRLRIMGYDRDAAETLV